MLLLLLCMFIIFSFLVIYSSHCWIEDHTGVRYSSHSWRLIIHMYAIAMTAGC